MLIARLVLKHFLVFIVLNVSAVVLYILNNQMETVNKHYYITDHRKVAVEVLRPNLLF